MKEKMKNSGIVRYMAVMSLGMILIIGMLFFLWQENKQAIWGTGLVLLFWYLWGMFETGRFVEKMYQQCGRTFETLMISDRCIFIAECILVLMAVVFCFAALWCKILLAGICGFLWVALAVAKQYRVKIEQDLS